MSGSTSRFSGSVTLKCTILLAALALLGSCATPAERRREQIEKQRAQLVENAVKPLGAAYASQLRPVISTLLARFSDDELAAPYAGAFAKSLTKHAVGDSEIVYAKLVTAIAEGNNGAADEAALLLQELVVSPRPAFVVALGRTTLHDLVAELGEPSHDFVDPKQNDQRCVVFTNPVGVYRLYSDSVKGRQKLHPAVLNSTPHFLVCSVDAEGRATACRVDVGASDALRAFKQETQAGVQGSCGVQWEEFAGRLTVTSPVVNGFRLNAVVDNGVEVYFLSLVYQRDSDAIGLDPGVLRTLRASWEVSDAFWDHGPSMTVTTDDGNEMVMEKVSEWGRGTSSCRMQYTAVVSSAQLDGWLRRALRFQKPRSNKVYELPKALIQGFLERLSVEKRARQL